MIADWLPAIATVAIIMAVAFIPGILVCIFIPQGNEQED